MSKKDEEAAMLAADKWKITQIKEFGSQPQNLATEVAGDIHYRLRKCFLAGCAHKEKQFERLVQWAKLARDFLDEVIDHNYYFGMSVSDITESYDEILKEVGDGE